jgi:hypothetical protein
MTYISSKALRLNKALETLLSPHFLIIRPDLFISSAHHERQDRYAPNQARLCPPEKAENVAYQVEEGVESVPCLTVAHHQYS